jgi:peroxiredoxin
VLTAGDTIPDARVWTAPGEGPVALRDAIATDGHALLCFYPFDWSRGCTQEMRHLHDRHADLAAAGVTAFAVSLDHPWSQQAWAASLAVAETVRFLSDRLGEAASGFGVLTERDGLPMAARSCFLVKGDSVRASWTLSETPLPDVDAIVAAASA